MCVISSKCLLCCVTVPDRGLSPLSTWQRLRGGGNCCVSASQAQLDVVACCSLPGLITFLIHTYYSQIPETNYLRFRAGVSGISNTQSIRILQSLGVPTQKELRACFVPLCLEEPNSIFKDKMAQFQWVLVSVSTGLGVLRRWNVFEEG